MSKPAYTWNNLINTLAMIGLAYFGVDRFALNPPAAPPADVATTPALVVTFPGLQGRLVAIEAAIDIMEPELKRIGKMKAHEHED